MGSNSAKGMTVEVPVPRKRAGHGECEPVGFDVGA
jgi:hypothetical protein